MRKGARERVFLDWSRPIIAEAASWLLDRFGSADRCDLQHVLCVTPTARGGRVLLARLVELCAQRHTWLIPPRTVTPRVMTDLLLDDGPVPRATAEERTQAWAIALRACRDDAAGPLLPAGLDDTDAAAWHRLSQRYADIHEELAGECRSFTDAAAIVDQLGLDREGDRWRALAAVHERACAILHDSGLVDPDESRRRAIEAAARRSDPGAPAAVILLAVVDLNQVQRRAIDLLADRAVALIHAPESLADHFDAWGCLIAQPWLAEAIEIDDARIHIADRPEDQAQEVMRQIAAIAPRAGADEITIGVGDPGLGPTIARHARWAGLDVHDAAGRPLAESPPCRLLETVAQWLRERRFATLAALLRHPDIDRALRRGSPASRDAHDAAVLDWSSLLDRYFTDHLHQRLTGRWLGDPAMQQRMAQAHDALAALLRPLLDGGSDLRPLGAWAGPILDVLANVYERQADGPPPRSRDACLRLRAAVLDLARSSPPLQPACDAASALRLMLAAIGRESVADEPRRDQIELLGWLELHVDPAPQLVIAGVNDGAIPATLSADAHLPDSLRAGLGLMNNERRYARDAYLLRAILASRPESVLIAGRRAAGNEPLTPSRLLVACGPDQLVARVRLMTGEAVAQATPGTPGAADIPGAGGGQRSASAAVPVGVAAPPRDADSQFTVPALPAPLAPPSSMRVTDFKLYLDCPYRYALERLVGLRAVSDAAFELDAMAFGDLAHQVLCAFGRSPGIAASDSETRIESFLRAELARRSRERFGDSILPAVRVQLAQLEARLRGFAACQARWAGEGWRIHHCEYEFTNGVALDIPGQPPMPIRARIDRIDRNESTGAWRILDYKTGESGPSPIRTHHDAGSIGSSPLRWFDLQLPLYHFLATRSGLGISGTIELGYIVLPRTITDVGWLQAGWTAAQLESAIDRARQVVIDIRAGRFGRNADFTSPFDAFARICQAMVFRDDEPEEETDDE